MCALICFVHCDIICILTLVCTRRKQSRTLTAPFYSYFESQNQIQCPSQLALLAIVQIHSFLLQCRAEQAVLHFLCLVLLNGLVSIAPPCWIVTLDHILGCDKQSLKVKSDTSLLLQLEEKESYLCCKTSTYVKQRKLKIHIFDVLSETQIKHTRRRMLKMMLVSILSLY